LQGEEGWAAWGPPLSDVPKDRERPGGTEAGLTTIQRRHEGRCVSVLGEVSAQ
jgi:hypothetical protein